MRVNRNLRVAVTFSILSFVIGFSFQNCAPEQYFKAVKVSDDSTDGSSTGGPFLPGPTVNPLGERYIVTWGELQTTADGKVAGMDIVGRVMMVRDALSGATETFAHGIGLVSGSNAAHVHDLPCSVNGGGGHYKIDYSVAAALQDNEIWPAIVAQQDGIGPGYVRTNQHFARAEAQAFVVHSASGARMACADLHSLQTSSTKGGRFLNTAFGTSIQNQGQGVAIIAREGGDNQTVVRLSINGLLPSTSYMAHVHNQACNNGDGGAHYKMNPNVTEVAASANNEIWPLFTTSTTGHGETRVAVRHVARADAMSVVIHDPANSANRLMCVDLSLDAGFIPTESGLTKFPNLFGTAKLVRTGAGETKVTVALSGLAPATSYAMHVHDRPCHIAGGGGHYKIDYSVAAAIESNEIWISATTDAVGAGTGTKTVKHIARPEAYSVVIHDADGSRLACSDLYF
ncbi:MAG: hypothetical protein AB7F86_05075 [Bdellovibrionales bacterium]